MIINSIWAFQVCPIKIPTCAPPSHPLFHVGCNRDFNDRRNIGNQMLKMGDLLWAWVPERLPQAILAVPHSPSTPQRVHYTPFKASFSQEEGRVLGVAEHKDGSIFFQHQKEMRAIWATTSPFVIPVYQSDHAFSSLKERKHKCNGFYMRRALSVGVNPSQEPLHMFQKVQLSVVSSCRSHTVSGQMNSNYGSHFSVCHFIEPDISGPLYLDDHSLTTLHPKSEAAFESPKTQRSLYVFLEAYSSNIYIMKRNHWPGFSLNQAIFTVGW